MKKHALGAIVLALGLTVGAGLGGEAKAFAGGALTIENAGGALQQVHYKKKHHKHHHHHKKHRKGGFVIHFGNIYPGPYGRHGGYKPAHRECHGVVKKGYFNGRYAKIGGTKCYDHYGRGYVVEGSRYVIHYY